MIMTRELEFGKVHKRVDGLLKSVAELARQGARVDVLERHLLESLFAIGPKCLIEKSRSLFP